VTLDATPPLGEHSPFFARTGRVGIYIDWARQRWNKYVVNYSLKMQAESVSEGWAALRRARAVMSRGFAPGGDLRRRAGFLAAALLPPFLLGALLWRVLGGRESRNGPESARSRGEHRAPRPYTRLLRRLATRGYRSSPGTTFEEMLLRASLRKPDLSAAASRFLALYHRDRFGPFPLPPADFREATRLAGLLGREIPTAGEM
jgi:hypothetical protein